MIFYPLPYKTSDDILPDCSKSPDFLTMAGALPVGAEILLEIFKISTDSLDKLSDESNVSPRIDVTLDQSNGTISVVDNGAGFTVLELCNLGSDTLSMGEPEPVRLRAGLLVADRIVVRSFHENIEEVAKFYKCKIMS